MFPKLGHTRLISLVSKACRQHRVCTPLLVLALKSHKKYHLVFINGSLVIRPSEEKKSKKASRRAYLNKIVKPIVIIL